MSSVQKYFAPLTAKSLAGGQGGLSSSGSQLHMHHTSNVEHQCSVLRISVDAGDIQGLPMNDQQMQDAGTNKHLQRDASPSKWSQGRSHSALAQRFWMQPACFDAAGPVYSTNASGVNSKVRPSASTSHWELAAPVSARLLRRESSANSSTTVQELDDEYELDDLDSDWRQLLGDVDARLLAQGARTMSARERSVAIKKLLTATGTKGVDFALNDALREVLAFRLVHG
eukprot:gene9793-9951_t